MKQAVILCGGKGTRLGEAFAHVPKPLVEVAGVPLLDRILAVCAGAGLTDIVLAAGHLGGQIEARYAEGNLWGLSIRVHRESEPRGTAGCLLEIEDQLEENFAVLYGDVFLDFDLQALLSRHEFELPSATILVRQSDHPGDSDLAELVEGTDLVAKFLPKSTRDPDGLYRNCANAAVYAFSRNLLRFVPRDRASDIATDVFSAALSGGAEIRAHWLEDTGFVKDMGTPTRLEQVAAYCRTKRGGDILPVKAVILDRDGVILEDHGPSVDPDAIRFMPGALEGLAAFHRAGVACHVATNQPWIARGLLTVEQLEVVHDRMRREVEAHGGLLGEILYSPYHPESHHGEGVKELRRASECRKPRPGMLLEIMASRGLRPGETVMIGDSRVDIVAAKNAGIRSVLVGGSSDALKAGPNFVAPDLRAVASQLVEVSCQ